MKDRSDVPAETRGDWPIISQDSKKRTKLPSCHQRDKTGGKRVCCRFRREHAHVEQERPELCRVGIRKKVSKCPTTVVTAKGEVQTKEEATVYVQELNLFVTIKLLEVTRFSHSKHFNHRTLV